MSAVRRDEVLVSRLDGASSWIRAEDVLGYDGVTLTVTPKIVMEATVAHVDGFRPVNQSISERALRSFNPQSFDA